MSFGTNYPVRYQLVKHVSQNHLNLNNLTYLGYFWSRCFWKHQTFMFIRKKQKTPKRLQLLSWNKYVWNYLHELQNIFGSQSFLVTFLTQWTLVKGRTLYALEWSLRCYKFHFNTHLKNPKLKPKTTNNRRVQLCRRTKYLLLRVWVRFRKDYSYKFIETTYNYCMQKTSLVYLWF